MASREINLTASLKVVGQARNRWNKFGVEVITPDVVFKADDSDLAKSVAQAMTERIKARLMAKQFPDGSPLPQASASTVERKQYREQQRQRHGKRNPRYLENTPARRSAARTTQREWNKRYRTRLTLPNTAHDTQTWGYESGLLAMSPAVVHEAWYKENAWTIYFADARAVWAIGRDGLTPVQRLWSRAPGGVASQVRSVVHTPEVREALERAQARMFSRGLGEAFAGLVGLAERVQSVAEEATEGVTDGG